MKVTLNSPNNNFSKRARGSSCSSDALSCTEKCMQTYAAMRCAGFSEDEAANDAFRKKHTFRTKCIRIAHNLFLKK